MWLYTLLACNPDPDRSSPGGPSDLLPPGPAHAGTRPAQRLNRVELERTLRALTGLELDVASAFPPDEVAWGFDNQAAALQTTVAHLEALEGVVDRLASELLADKDESDRTFVVQGEGPGVTYAGDGRTHDDQSYLLFDGSLSAAISLEDDGVFELAVRVGGEADASGPPILEIEVDGEVVASEAIEGRALRDVAVSLSLDQGLHGVTLRIANPSPAGSTPRRVLGVDLLALSGPRDPEVGRSAVWERLVPCALDGAPDPACRERALQDFAHLAWRRPPSPEDLAFLVGLAETVEADGGTPGEALVAGIRGILLSPDFLFRLERSPAPGEADRALDGHEVAARLAAFLWSSTPDEALLDAAAAGSLLTEEGLDAEVRRMLRDRRSVSLVEDLAGQWFDLRDVALVAPDPTTFPDFDEALRASMAEELRLLSDAFFRGDADLRWVVETDETWIDERLAAHYRVDDPGRGFVSTYTGRVGITGTAAFLATHARPTRASAVSRGRWVLENLLCDAPPPPPPAVNMAMAFTPVDGSVRDQEEAIRGEGSCAACHASMDAIGYALGGFDAIGAARVEDELGWPVDTAVTLDGEAIEDQAALAAFLANDPRLPRCAAEQTLTFALGRPLDPADDPVVDAVTAEFVAGGSTFEALATAIVRSAPFRRKGAAGTGGVE